MWGRGFVVRNGIVLIHIDKGLLHVDYYYYYYYYY